MYHLSAKREGDEFFTEGGLVNENSNEGGFLFIMNLKIWNCCQQHVFSANINLWNHYIYWRTVSWDSKQRPLRKKIPQWRGQALFRLTNEKW